MTEQDHWADPAYIVENADGEYVGAHSGRKDLAHDFRRFRDEEHPADGPHQVRETKFHEVNGTGEFEGSPLTSTCELESGGDDDAE